MRSGYSCLLEELQLFDGLQSTPFTGRRKYVDVVKFREVLGTALAQQVCSQSDAGHSWIVDTEENYRYRLGDDKATLPAPPSRPKEPSDLVAASWEFDRYLMKQEQYTLYMHWNQAALAVLEHRFPSCLAFKRTRLGLPLLFTIREAMDYMEGLCNSEVERSETFRARFKEINNRVYKHNLNGPIEYFAAMQSDKHIIDLVKCGDMPYVNLIMHCQKALQESGLPKQEMKTIDADWQKADEAAADKVTAEKAKTQPDPNITYTADEKWTAFTTFYIKRINELIENGVAAPTVALSTRMSALARSKLLRG